MMSSPKSAAPTATPANLSSNKISTNERGIPLPWFTGRRSLPLQQAQTRIYNPRSTPIKSKVGKNKQQVTGYNGFGDLVGITSCCVVDRLFGLEIGGTLVWEGLIERDVDNPIFAPLSLPDGSTWRFYWGTEDQVLDTLVLSTCGEDHPHYLGQSYLVGKDVAFGSNTETPPNIRVLAERSAKFPGLDEALVHEGSNPVTAIAELIGDDWFGLGLPDLIHTATWAALCPLVRREQALALPGAPDHVAALGYLAAFLDKQQPASAIISALLEHFDGWLRPLGEQLEIGYFPHTGVTPDDLPEFSYHDFVQHPEFNSDSGEDSAPRTDVTVVFNDRTQAGEENTASVANAAAAQRLGENNPLTVRRPFLCTSYQAALLAAELARDRARPAASAPAALRRSRLGTLREGDLFILNDAPSGYRQVVRITQRTDPSTGGEVRLTVIEERGLAPLPFIPPPFAAPVLPPPDLVPVAHARAFQLPRAFADTGPAPAVTILAERPAEHIAGYRLNLSTDDATYDEILTEGRWALRGTLVSTITSGATSLTLAAAGPELALLESASAAEQLDDTLLLFCGYEILSIGAVVAAGGGNYTVAVTRGRRGSAAAGHAAAAECYVCPRANLEVLQNANFPRTSSTRYFKLPTYTPREEQALADALKLTFTFDAAGVVTPTGLTATAKIEAVFIEWAKLTDPSIAMVEIWERSAASPVPVDGDAWQFELLANGFHRGGLAPGSHKYYWIRYRDTINDKSSIVGPVDATATEDARVDIEIADRIAADALIAATAAAKNRSFYATTAPSGSPDGIALRAGDLWFDTDDGNRIYRHSGSAWVDVQRVLGQIDFGAGIAPLGLVATLPSPSGYTGPSVVFLSTDQQLYRYTGSAWTLAIPAVNITGTLTDAQLAAIAAAKITGQLTNAQIADLAGAKLTGSISVATLPAGSVTGQLTNAQIADLAGAKLTGSISVATLPAGSVTGALTNAQIADLAAAKITGTLSDSQLAAIAAAKVTGQIVSTQITDGAISTPKLAAGAVTANEIAANAITAAKIAAGTITATELAAGSVTTAKLVASAVTAGEIAAGAVTTAKLAAGAVTANEIAANTITAGKIAAATITATELAAGSVTTAKLAASAVTAGEIAAGAVTTAKLAAGAVTANEIAAATITAANIAVSAITATQLAAGAVTTAKLAAGAVTANEIAANTITAGKIAAGAITATTVGANQIITSAANIADATITSAKIASIEAGLITAGNITVALALTSGGTFTAGTGTDRVQISPAGTLFGSDAGSDPNILVKDNGGNPGIIFRLGGTTKGAIGITSAGKTYFAGDATNSELTAFSLVSSSVVKATSSANPHTSDAPLFSSGGLYVGGDGNIIGYLEAASFKVGGNQVVGSRKAAITAALNNANIYITESDFTGSDTLDLTPLVTHLNAVDVRLNELADTINLIIARLKVTGGHGLIAD